MSVRRRRKYVSDFKPHAVLLTEEPDRTIAEVEENLGLSKDLLYRWRKEYRHREDLAFPGQGREGV